jgi:hypothetical protein
VYRSSTAGATVDVIFDVTGYFLADASGATYHPVAPGRVLDTRPTSGSRIHIGLSGKFTNKAVRTIAVAGVKGLGWSSALVPANATAITANLTIVNATSAGFASLGPTVAAVPKTSTINVAAGKIIANGVTVSLRSGTIQAVWDGTNGSSADFLLDVTGYFLSGSGGLSFYLLDPYRVLDSSQGTGLSGSFATGTARTLAVGGTGGSAGVPADAAGIAGNLTLVSPSSAGYAVVSPSISGIPSSSTVNTSAGVSVANGFDVPLDTTGQLMLGWYGTIGSTANLSLDVNGYWK